ncbi:MAG: Secretion system C-terminal sorting domain [Bacteroidota bacterium]|jgi:hypothetical protein
MKNIKIALGSLLTVFMSNQFIAQQGLEGIVVEKYYVSGSADSINADNELAPYALTTGSITYRVYANLLPGYKVIQMFGNAEHPLKFNTSTAFFNDPNYGVAVFQGTSLNNTKKHTTLIDSYLTIGGVCDGQFGVLKTEDTDGTIGNNQGILANFSPIMGLPIMGANGQDGLMPGNPAIPNLLGITNELDPIDQIVGGSIQIVNGTIAALGGVEGVTPSNHVLLGQFTTDGDLSFELNLQLATPVAGGSEIYVASFPGTGQFTDTTLIYHSNPSASIEEHMITEAMNNLVVSPNPVVDQLQMNWLTQESYENYQLEVIDLEGKVLLAIPHMTNNQKVDIKDLQAGVYLVKVKAAHSQATQRIIKL